MMTYQHAVGNDAIDHGVDEHAWLQRAKVKRRPGGNGGGNERSLGGERHRAGSRLDRLTDSTKKKEE